MEDDEEKTRLRCDECSYFEFIDERRDGDDIVWYRLVCRGESSFFCALLLLGRQVVVRHRRRSRGIGHDDVMAMMIFCVKQKEVSSLSSSLSSSLILGLGFEKKRNGKKREKNDAPKEKTHHHNIEKKREKRERSGEKRRERHTAERRSGTKRSAEEEEEEEDFFKNESTFARGKIHRAPGVSETFVHPGYEISQRRGVRVAARRSHAREHAEDGTAQRPERRFRGVSAPAPDRSQDYYQSAHERRDESSEGDEGSESAIDGTSGEFEDAVGERVGKREG